MDNVKHNGWANYDTWKVVVFIDNVEKNYRKIKINRLRLVKLNASEMKAWLRNNLDFMGDKITWSNVNTTELKKWLKDNNEWN